MSFDLRMYSVSVNDLHSKLQKLIKTLVLYVYYIFIHFICTCCYNFRKPVNYLDISSPKALENQKQMYPVIRN